MNVRKNGSPYSGLKALVMGLGLNGGGLESARYLARMGAEVTVTDQKDEKALSPSIEKLSEFPIRYVLGRHEIGDFSSADMVIKNPGVNPDSPYLKAARRVETDISLFLAASPARLCAVTGSKGKSGIASALKWVLGRAGEDGLIKGRAFLGGNIATSPLSFLDELSENDEVVLELSSWQLGDIAGRGLLKPRAAVLSAIMSDHMDRYGSMEAYISDKKNIYREQDQEDCTVTGDDCWGKIFRAETRGRPLVYAEAPLPPGDCGGWLAAEAGLVRLPSGETEEIVPEKLLVPGRHQKKNFLAAALALFDLGLPASFIGKSLAAFPGIEHRLEFFHESGGVCFYNDSAATIPEAAAAAILAFDRPVVLVTGGSDKNLDFAPLANNAAMAKGIVLLAGNGTDKLIPLLKAGGVPYHGPFDSLDTAVESALRIAGQGDSVVLSPGCTSFGMFLNEFDRGRKWKEAVLGRCF